MSKERQARRSRRCVEKVSVEERLASLAAEACFSTCSGTVRVRCAVDGGGTAVSWTFTKFGTKEGASEKDRNFRSPIPESSHSALAAFEPSAQKYLRPF